MYIDRNKLIFETRDELQTAYNAIETAVEAQTDKNAIKVLSELLDSIQAIYTSW